VNFPVVYCELKIITSLGPFSWFSVVVPSDYYTFSASNVGKTTFTLSATPKGAQTNDSCGTLTHNDIQGYASGVSNCW